MQIHGGSSLGAARQRIHAADGGPAHGALQGVGGGDPDRRRARHRIWRGAITTSARRTRRRTGRRSPPRALTRSPRARGPLQHLLRRDPQGRHRAAAPSRAGQGRRDGRRVRRGAGQARGHSGTDRAVSPSNWVTSCTPRRSSICSVRPRESEPNFTKESTEPPPPPTKRQ